jgi:hypothetical protein
VAWRRTSPSRPLRDGAALKQVTPISGLDLVSDRVPQRHLNRFDFLLPGLGMALREAFSLRLDVVDILPDVIDHG